MVVVNELGNQEPVGSVAPFPEPYVIVSHHTARRQEPSKNCLNSETFMYSHVGLSCQHE